MLKILNKIFVKIQRYFQGIPRGPANLYEKISSKILIKMYRNVAEEVKNIWREGNILEIGCGTGKLIIEILKNIRVKNIIGLDISNAMIEISRKNLVKNNMYSLVDLVLADAHKIPLRNKCIDLVISTGTLHHIRKPRKMFNECKRVLRNKGMAWIYELSHDISREELIETAEYLGKPKYLIKIISVMHGLPRQVYEKGFVKKSLENIKYSIEYRGAITKLIITSN